MAFMPGIAMADGRTDDARQHLKKWGLAYCLNKYKKTACSSTDESLAQEAYFQSGAHNSEQAYTKVRQFFDMAFKNNNDVDKERGEAIVLARCLDAYESVKYKKLIISQDRFVK